MFSDSPDHATNIHAQASVHFRDKGTHLSPCKQGKGYKKGINPETACPSRSFYVILHLCNQSLNKKTLYGNRIERPYEAFGGLLKMV